MVDQVGVGLRQGGAQLGKLLVALLIPLAEVGEQRLHGRLDVDDWRNGGCQAGARLQRFETYLPGQPVTGADLAARIDVAVHPAAHRIQAYVELLRGLGQSEPAGVDAGARVGVQAGEWRYEGATTPVRDRRAALAVCAALL
ncbi:MAG TPA: hypothetical protein VGK33_21595 [Chloroflexota bacterium]